MFIRDIVISQIVLISDIIAHTLNQDKHQRIIIRTAWIHHLEKADKYVIVERSTLHSRLGDAGCGAD